MNAKPAKGFAMLLMLLSATSWAFTADSLKVGERAPDFELPAATKDSIVRSGIRLSDTLGKTAVILAFYPADWSGGCTTEMCTMRDNFSSLADLGASVLGISGDYVFSHHEWAKFHNLPFPLLSDHDHAVARAYASYNPKTGFNRRTIYVIDRNGTIAYIDLDYKSGSKESFDRLKAALHNLK